MWGRARPVATVIGMRRTTLRKRAALAAVTPLLALSLAACGGDTSADDSGSDDATSSESAEDGGESGDSGTDESGESGESGDDTTDEDSGDDPAAGDEVDPTEFTDDLKSAMEDGETAHMTMAMTGTPAEVQMEGDVDYTTDPPSMSAVMSPAGQAKIQFRLVDDFVYMNMGPLTQDKFVKAGIDDKNSPLGDMSGMRESMDPLSSFESFTEGLEKVVLVGDEKVQGEDTQHYRLTLDTAKITALEDVTGQPGGPAKLGLKKKLSYDIWLDDDDRMRQVKIDMGKKLGALEMNVSKWNEPVKITAPKKNELTQLPGS